MKKIFGTLVLSLLVSTSALADTNIPWTKEGCESVKGVWVTANSATDEGCDAAHCNGMNFCRNTFDQNWWSALLWCKAIGRELTDVETACPNGIASSKSCANLKGKVASAYWTSTPSPTNAGRSVYVGDNSVTLDWSYGTRSMVGQLKRYALCK